MASSFRHVGSGASNGQSRGECRGAIAYADPLDRPVGADQSSGMRAAMKWPLILLAATSLVCFTGAGARAAFGGGGHIGGGFGGGHGSFGGGRFGGGHFAGGRAGTF